MDEQERQRIVRFMEENRRTPTPSPAASPMVSRSGSPTPGSAGSSVPLAPMVHPQPHQIAAQQARVLAEQQQLVEQALSVDEVTLDRAIAKEKDKLRESVAWAKAREAAEKVRLASAKADEAEIRVQQRAQSPQRAGGSRTPSPMLGRRGGAAPNSKEQYAAALAANYPGALPSNFIREHQQGPQDAAAQDSSSEDSFKERMKLVTQCREYHRRYSARVHSYQWLPIDAYNTSMPLDLLREHKFNMTLAVNQEGTPSNFRALVGAAANIIEMNASKHVPMLSAPNTSFSTEVDKDLQMGAFDDDFEQLGAELSWMMGYANPFMRVAVKMGMAALRTVQINQRPIAKLAPRTGGTRDL